MNEPHEIPATWQRLPDFIEVPDDVIGFIFEAYEETNVLYGNTRFIWITNKHKQNTCDYKLHRTESGVYAERIDEDPSIYYFEEPEPGPR